MVVPKNRSELIASIQQVDATANAMTITFERAGTPVQLAVEIRP